MRRSLRSLLSTLLLLAGAASAAEVDGVLTMRWGDPLDGAGEEKLQAELAGDNGYRYAIAAHEALDAGLDLHALNGQRVRADVDGLRKSNAGFRLAAVAAKSGSAPEPVNDARPWINLLCKFADLSDEPTTAARIDAAFAPGGALTGYFEEVSGGFVDLGRSASLGWFALPAPRSAYVDGQGNPNLSKLLNDCASAAGTALAERVQAEDHAGINVLVNGSLGCCAWGGNAYATIGGVAKTWRVTWAPPSAYLNIALLGHELAHAFGMAHSNNSDGDATTYDNPWDLLSDSTAHAVWQSTYGSLPKTPAAYHLDKAGWLDASEKRVVAGETTERVTLQRIDRPADGAVRLLRIEAPDWTDGRYYAVEARVRAGGRDARLPDDGVVIYEVRPNRAQPGWLVDAQDPAANYSNTRSVVFKPGDRFVAPDRSFELSVQAAAGDAFVVEVALPGPGFDSGFE